MGYKHQRRQPENGKTDILHVHSTSIRGLTWVVTDQLNLANFHQSSYKCIAYVPYWVSHCPTSLAHNASQCLQNMWKRKRRGAQYLHIPFSQSTGNLSIAKTHLSSIKIPTCHLERLMSAHCDHTQSSTFFPTLKQQSSKQYQHSCLSAWAILKENQCFLYSPRPLVLIVPLVTALNPKSATYIHSQLSQFKSHQ